MLALLDNGQDLDECARELGCEVGQLLTPLTRYRLRDPARPFAIDNGRFSSGWEPGIFLSLLERNEGNRDRCLFVTVPDVIESARRTLEVFERWRPRLKGWKLALACQDGQQDLPMPWDEIDAVFIGGSTTWKCSQHATQIIQAAQALGKWVHVGRVNRGIRWAHFEQLGVNSVDGTGVARYTHMREAVRDRDHQGELLHEEHLRD